MRSKEEQRGAARDTEKQGGEGKIVTRIESKRMTEEAIVEDETSQRVR